MLSEALEALAIHKDGTYIDATFGRGGHAREILKRLSSQGSLIAFDRDLEAVKVAQELGDPRLKIHHSGFSAICELPASSVDGVLLDLGVSSPQIDNPARGFSFRFDGPLDMRMDSTQEQSLQKWLSKASEAEIAQVIREYGEERFANAIAKAIVMRREDRGLPSGTAELARLVGEQVRTREYGQDPATRTFQAFRIHINQELEELKQALVGALSVLKPEGRLAVISFHSLEDRIVKQFINGHSKEEYDRRNPFAPPKAMSLQALGRVRASEEEIKANPRSRSAILRVAKRLGSLT
jgi:16S rRNA (cytosine1402-N4)-methyltransferase